MATTVAAICNLALLHCGVTRRITDIDNDNTNESRACVTSYPIARDDVLESVEWPFATATVALALVTDYTATTDPYEWAYAYRLPSDCIKARHIVSSVRRNDLTPKFSLAQDADGLLLVTDEVDPTLVYTKRWEDPARYAASFANAIAWRMAVDLAPALSRDLAWAERAEQRAPFALSSAAAKAFNGIIEDDLPDAESTQARA